MCMPLTDKFVKGTPQAIIGKGHKFVIFKQWDGAKYVPSGLCTGDRRFLINDNGWIEARMSPSEVAVWRAERYYPVFSWKKPSVPDVTVDKSIHKMLPVWNIAVQGECSSAIRSEYQWVPQACLDPTLHAETNRLLTKAFNLARRGRKMTDRIPPDVKKRVWALIDEAMSLGNIKRCKTTRKWVP